MICCTVLVVKAAETMHEVQKQLMSCKKKHLCMSEFCCLPVDLPFFFYLVWRLSLEKKERVLKVKFSIAQEGSKEEFTHILTIFLKICRSLIWPVHM